jgi:hypothetical protein
MATPINFQPLPSAQACHNGVITMGAPVAQMAMSLKTLNQVKFRSAGFYHVGRSTYFSQYVTAYKKAAIHRGSQPGPTKGQTDEFDFFYFSLPTSEWIGVEIIYGASTINPTTLNGPNILLELYEISGGAIGTKIDEGCVFTYPDQIQIVERTELTGANRVNTGSRLFTFPSGGLSAPTIPRPLYIPPANRGDELAVRVTAEEVIIYAVHLFDIYQEA